MSDHETRQWTDEAVAALPLTQGRAELLEEIMSTSATDTTAPARPDRPSPRRWAVPLAAAAAVATVAVLVATQGGDERATEPAPAVPTSAAPTQIVLDTSGWTVGSSPVDPEMQEISYDLPGQEYDLDVKRYPAPEGLTLEMITDEHRDVTDPPSAGEPLEVAGLEARSWSYNPVDRVVSTEPVNGYWWDIRAGGMDDATFAALLGDLRLVDQAGFEASLPEDFVLSDEREAAVAELVDGIVAVTGVGLPEGVDGPETVELDPSYVAIDALDGYACPWFAVYLTAQADGDEDAAAEAGRVLATARDWPALAQADPEGDGYGDVFLQFADRAAAGEAIRAGQLRDGLGCGPA